ncbi:hypothetical protein CLV92_11592 [Kineococcus xinjiangensis]|uniref:Uncharacterized protein n=1 Tax=Kineococcus xinjiangensis TaxID=512762 RepID=A0A2S6IDS7_9ACTN|nr:hypothetical protein [Kineococcus xinjiangensis]PPK92346.1 hypothetical protein CLV92_11592 [Kineococcus xinjiangensis]
MNPTTDPTTDPAKDSVRELLETAARAAPREHDPVAVVLRRHRRDRHRTAAVAAAGALAAACAVGIAVVALPGPGAAPPLTPGATQAPPASQQPPAPEWTPPPLRVSERGLNGVEVTAPGYGAASSDVAEQCPVPGTVTVSTAPASRTWCESGPGAVVQPISRRDWQTGYPASPGLQLVDGVPAFVSTFTGEVGGQWIVLPTRGVQVLVTGDEEEQAHLLDSLRIAADPGERSAPARASRADLALATLTPVSGDGGGQSQDPELLRQLAAVVDAAPAADGDAACLPAPGDFAQVDLQTTPDADPRTGPVDEYTYLALDLTGACDVVFSSTGAVLQPDRTLLGPLLERLRESEDWI